MALLDIASSDSNSVIQWLDRSFGGRPVDVFTVSGDDGTVAISKATAFAAAVTFATTLAVTGVATFTAVPSIPITDTNSNITATKVDTAIDEIAKFLPIELADPGTGVAIPVVRSATINITTAAAETNTLAIPSFVGQTLRLHCAVRAVGDRVITSAQSINQAGNTIMTFGAARDVITLIAVKITGGALRWQVAYNDGVALS